MKFRIPALLLVLWPTLLPASSLELASPFVDCVTRVAALRKAGKEIPADLAESTPRCPEPPYNEWVSYTEPLVIFQAGNFKFTPLDVFQPDGNPHVIPSPPSYTRACFHGSSVRTANGSHARMSSVENPPIVRAKQNF